MTDAALRGLGPWVARFGAWLALALAIVFAARRLAGGWERALDGPSLVLVTTIVVGGLVVFRRQGHRRNEAGAAERRPRFLQLLASIAAVLWAAVVTSSQSPVGGLALLWIALAGEEFWFWRQALASWRRGWRHREANPVTAIRRGEPETSDEAASTENFSPDRTQQIVRFRDEQGTEAIHGLLRAALAPQQRVAHLHVAFCPPLAAAPEFACEQIDGPAAMLNAAQVESYGARIDIRLAEPAYAGDSIVVEFFAREKRIAGQAAERE